MVGGSVATANQGCGCGPIQGAYFTSEVLRFSPNGVAEVSPPGLLRPRAFATVIPLPDDDHYLVLDGYIAERDGDPADDAHEIELCSIRTGCAPYGDTDDPNLDGIFAAAPGAPAYLADGTVLTRSFTVRRTGTGYAVTRATHGAVVQVGTSAVVQDRGTVSVVTDGTTPPRSLGVFAGHTLAAAIDDTHVLLLSTADTLVLDLTSGASEHSPGPGPRARIEAPIPVALGAIVLDDDAGALRFDASTKLWRPVPAFVGERWTVELTSAWGDLAIVSAGDPDPGAARPYRLALFTGDEAALEPIPEPSAFNLGATWMEMSNGVLLRIGGALSWFDTIDGLAAG